MTLSKTLSAFALSAAVALGAGQAYAAAGGQGHGILGAVVAADGSHTPGTGGTGLISTSKTGTGQYLVTLARNRDRCFVSATVGRRTTSSQPHGFITVIHGASSDQYFVRTFDQSNAPVDSDFMLLAYCVQ